MVGTATSRCVFTGLVLVWPVLLVCASAPADEPATPLTMMTYNIGAYSPTIPLGPAEMAQIAQEIKDAQADVVGMTEVDVGTRNGTAPYLDMVAGIDAALAAIDYPMLHYDTTTVVYYGGYGVLVIWSRYPIVSTGFEETWRISVTSWKVARASVQFTPDHVVHCFMTHYYIGDAEAYQAQTDAVLGYVRSFPGPRVLMGDFNFGPGSAYYNQYIAAGWQDSCVAAGQSDCLTVGTGAGIPAPLPRVGQIDFIFGSADINFTDAYVPGSTVSDHWPLVAGLLGPPTQATIALLPAALTAQTFGHTDVENQTFEVSNSGTGILNYAITADADWLDVDPTGGTSVNESDTITVAYDTAGLEAGSYQATVTVADPDAGNSPQTLDVTLTISVPGDFDGDRDVDQEDFGRFQTCLTGLGIVQNDPDCAPAKLDHDKDVDQNDFSLFQRCMTGANVEGSLGCASRD